jgi:hypothetical protein
LAIAQFKTPSSPLSDPRPTIELMRSININELRRVIPRYSNTVNEPNVSLKYPDIARLRLSPSCLEITHYFRARTMLPYRMGLSFHLRCAAEQLASGHRKMAEFALARSGIDAKPQVKPMDRWAEPLRIA